MQLARWLVLIGVAGGLAACAGGPGAGSSGVAIKVLSNRADLVSGGDALVEIVLPQAATADGLRVDVDGRDISSSFKQSADSRVVGLITGLKDGANVVIARLGSSGARLTITNHPLGGPIFSGPQVQPWVCATPTAQDATNSSPATNASGLSTAATDAQCNIASEDHLSIARPSSAPSAATVRRASSRTIRVPRRLPTWRKRPTIRVRR